MEEKKDTRIAAYTIDTGKLVKTYPSVKEAAKEIGGKNIKKTAENITRALNGRDGRKTAYGFRWQRVNFSMKNTAERDFKRKTRDRLAEFRANGGKFYQLECNGLSQYEIRVIYFENETYPFEKWELLAKALDRAEEKARRTTEDEMISKAVEMCAEVSEGTFGIDFESAKKIVELLESIR